MAMTDDDIKGILVREMRGAKANDDTELAKKRQRNLEYYDGKMDDTPAEVGRSSVVSRDVADHVGWMLPQVMRVFMASKRMVLVGPADTDEIAPEFIDAAMQQIQEGQEPEQVIEELWEQFVAQEAQDATEYLNHCFWKANKGYLILRSATWDGMVTGDGIVKLWHDDTPEYETEFRSNLSDDEVALIEASEDEEITNQTTEEVQEQLEGPDGSLVLVPVNRHEVKVRKTKSRGRRRIDCIPPEDYLRSDDPPGTDRPRFEGHRSYKTRSELIQMGFDRKKVDDLSKATNDSVEQNTREEGYEPPRDISDKSMETVEYIEGYLQADVDDDGIAEVLRCHYAGSGDGGVLLDWEVWEDDGPFFPIPCDPIPHRWNSDSVADETVDIQRVKTVLWRQSLDNTYASNNPTRFVTGDIINPDELFSPSFGGAIFGKIGSSVTALPVPFVANHAYEAMTYADEVAQRRTGVSRQSMALDPEALQNQTATANQNNKDASYSQVEQVARDAAELGWAPLFRAWLKLERKYQTEPKRFRVGKQTITVTPANWNPDMNLTVNVGLGTGSRDRDMAMLGQVLANQLGIADRFLASGATEQAIEMLPKIIDTMVKIAESAGLQDPESYYPDDAEAIVAKLKEAAAQPPPPNPKLEEIKAEGEVQASLKQVDAQVSMQEAELKAKGDVVKNQAELEADLQTKEADRQNAIAIEQIKQAGEAARQQREIEFEMWKISQQNAMERERLAMAAIQAREQADASAPPN